MKSGVGGKERDYSHKVECGAEQMPVHAEDRPSEDFCSRRSGEAQF